LSRAVIRDILSIAILAYGVTTARLNQQVRRNRTRFPPDFLFELTRTEFPALMMQDAISKSGRGGRRKLPLAFTEHGAIMVATVLNSPRALKMSVYVARAFVKLREILTSNRDLANRLAALERSLIALDVKTKQSSPSRATRRSSGAPSDLPPTSRRKHSNSPERPRY
jgi:hypothetical protein